MTFHHVAGTLSPTDVVDDHLSDPAVMIETLHELRRRVALDGARRFEIWRGRLTRPDYEASARNLASYLALRSHDLRGLQTGLMRFGLSSLGRCESRVMENLDAVIAMLEAGAGSGGAAHLLPVAERAAYFRGLETLSTETERVFGTPAGHRQVRIMVTVPGTAGDDPAYLHDLLSRGVEALRINCAHGDEASWRRIVANLRRAEEETGRSCKVVMDLVGPRCRIGDLAMPGEQALVAGDRFLLTAEAPRPGATHPAQVHCPHEELLERLVPGHTVHFDEGRLSGKVIDILPEGVLVEVTRAHVGVRLRAEKGLNFPDTQNALPTLTRRDNRALDFAVEFADVVGLSFVRDAEDVIVLQDAIRARRPDRADMPVIAKVETAQAVRNLPEIIIQAAGRQPLAVMIARGDLAVEIGYQRLAEVQEEILWLCEAAHVPVVWATQVLDRYVKTGELSRAEVTDAAMAERAECVMLNKGPHVADAVTLLDDVLSRMEAHQSKKTSRLRALRAW